MPPKGRPLKGEVRIGRGLDPTERKGLDRFRKTREDFLSQKKIITIIITIMVILIRQRQADRVENLGQTKKKKTQRAKMGKIGNEKGKWKAKKKEKKRKRENLEIKRHPYYGPVVMQKRGEDKRG